MKNSERSLRKENKDLKEKILNLENIVNKKVVETAMFRNIADHSSDLIWAKNKEKQYIFANKKICEKLLIAKDTSEPIGKTDIFFALRQRESHPNDPDYHTFGEICVDSDDIVLKSGKSKKFDEYGNVRGEFLFLEVHKSPLYNSDGDLIGTVGIGRDMTLEKNTEKQKEDLRHADRMISLGILVSGIAHEINNPNSTIGLSSSFLERSFKDIIPILDNYSSENDDISIGGLNYRIFKNEINNILKGIRESSRRIKSIVEELKDYSRKEKNVFKTEVDINSIIKSAINLMQGMINKSTKNFKVSYGKNLPVIS